MALADVGTLLDAVTDDIGQLVSIFRNTPNPVVTSQQTNAAVYLAQQRSQQQTLLVLGLGALAIFALRK